jgi:hypothetical protein
VIEQALPTGRSEISSDSSPATLTFSLPFVLHTQVVIAAFKTWLQAGSALFTALAAGAAWAATYQVKAAADEQRRLRIWDHLKVVHDLVSELALANPNDPREWQPRQLSLRRETTVVFTPLPKCGEFAGADLWKVDEAAYPELAREAMAEVEAAMGDIWKGVYRWSWFRRRPVTLRVYPPPGESQVKD